MDDRETNYASRLLLLAPVIFACHFLEESPTFVQWFNMHVARGITPGLFWRVNLYALAITFIVVGIQWFSRSAFSLTLAIVWFSCLMLANAIFHIAGGVVDWQYVPGLATAILLYLPYYCWLFVKAVKSKQVSVRAFGPGGVAWLAADAYTWLFDYLPRESAILTVQPLNSGVRQLRLPMGIPCQQLPLNQTY